MSSNMEDMKTDIKVEYEIRPSTPLHLNSYSLFVKCQRIDKKKKMQLKICSLQENTAKPEFKKLTVGDVWEEITDLPYSNNGSPVLALHIRVYEESTFANGKKEHKIGEVQISLTQNTPDKQTVYLNKMAKGKEPKLKLHQKSEDSHSEVAKISEHGNSDKSGNLKNNLENVKDKDLESRVSREKKSEITDLKTRSEDSHSEVVKISENGNSYKSDNLDLESRMSKMEDEMKREIKGLKTRLDNKEKMTQPDMPVQINNSGVIFSCSIKPPPGPVTKIHKQIIKLIKTTLGKHGHTIVEGGSGPTLVTVVNSSRTKEDIDRDMKAAKLTDSEASDVILLRIVPSLTHNIKVKEMKGENYKLDLVFLAEQSAKKLHECEKNVEACEELFEYLENCLNCE